MIHSGVEVNIGYSPPLALDFLPLYAFIREYSKGAKHRIAIMLEQKDGYISVFDTCIHGTLDRTEADFGYLDLAISFLSRSRGGFRLSLCCDGAEWIDKWLRKEFAPENLHLKGFNPLFRNFSNTPDDFRFMPYSARLEPKEASIPFGRHLDGCRIGFDAGGSDRKVAAVIDGETVFSEEVEWLPKLHSDPAYHYQEVLSSLRAAAGKMPRVDAVGVSSAGAVVNNRLIGSSIFQSIPRPYPEGLEDIYIRAAQEVCDLPVVASNDGNVSALAWSMSTNKNRILGTAMGTSLAGGYIDKHGNITSWRNGLSAMQVDLSDSAAIDKENSKKGVGSQYLSQNAVIRLSERAGIEMVKTDTPAQKLRMVQRLMEENDPRTDKVFESIGCFLGHTVPLYAYFYDMRYMPVYGRVASGMGGDRIVQVCNKILREEYPDVYSAVEVALPDEQSRRIGQCVAAASLPELG